jgi:hypothetical protein
LKRIESDRQATLVVVGSAGLYYLPADSARIRLDASTRQPLSTGDGFIIRKKLFRFEAAAGKSPRLSPTLLNTPVRSQNTPAKTAASSPLRRRASHRLSLLPADKPFVPLSPMKRRQSGMGQSGRTPKKSHLSQSDAVEEDEEDEEVMEGIVDVQHNEEGDLVILETREERSETGMKVS